MLQLINYTNTTKEKKNITVDQGWTMKREHWAVTTSKKTLNRERPHAEVTSIKYLQIKKIMN